MFGKTSQKRINNKRREKYFRFSNANCIFFLTFATNNYIINLKTETIMKKFLRFSLMTMLALFGMGDAMAQGTEINFDDNYATLFPMVTGVSSGSGNTYVADGEFQGSATSIAVSGYTVTLTPAEEATIPNRIWATSPRLRMYSGTFSVSGANITQIEFVAGSNFNLKEPTSGTLTEKVWKGSAVSEVTFTVEKNTQLKKIIINGDDVTPVTPDPVETTGSGTLADPYTSADAIAVANALASGAKTVNDVYVKGKISSIKYTFNEEHGTATFFISDNGSTENQFQCYQVLYLENKDWKDGNSQIEVGDAVIICGKLMNYQGNTPETSTREAYIYSLNGNTVNEISVGPVTFIGDGSQGNPYLVSDLRQMTSDNYTEDKVWVKGIIIGTAKSKTALNEEDVISNIAIAVSASDTEFIPVELKSGTNFRQDINLVDHPENKGKEILIHGQIIAYFSTTGVKNLDEAVLDGVTISGISEISADTDVNAPAYNVAGQRVNSNYKGVVVKNGKKFIK